MPGRDFQHVAVGLTNEVASLTWFSYQKMYGRFAGKNILAVITRWPGRINEVATRRGSTVLFYCFTSFSGRTFINRSVQSTFKLTILAAHVLSC